MTAADAQWSEHCKQEEQALFELLLHSLHKLTVCMVRRGNPPKIKFLDASYSEGDPIRVEVFIGGKT